MDLNRTITGGILLIAFAAAAQALQRVEIVVGDVQGEGWQAQDVRLQLALPTGADLGGEITVAALTLPAPIGAVGALRLQCDVLRHDAAGTHCSGRARIGAVLGETLPEARVHLDRDAGGALRLRLQDVLLAAGTWQFDLQLRAGHWELAAQGRHVDATAVQALLTRLDVVFGYTLGGRLDLDLTLRGDAGGVAAAEFDLAAEGVDFSNADGTQAGEQLGLQLVGEGQQRGSDWQGSGHVRLTAGALFVDPLYFEFTETAPLRLEAVGHWAGASGRLALSSLRLDHTGVARAQGALTLYPGRENLLGAVSVDIEEARLPAAFDTYIQPWVRGQLGDAFKTVGRFSGRYAAQADGSTRLRVALDGVGVDDPQGRFGIEGLSGLIDWGNDAMSRTTELSWRAGSVYRLAFGPANLAVVSQDSRFELREPLTLPVLDGALQIDTLALSDPGGADLRWNFDGMLLPVSMEAVSAALDWPPFGGQLSGMVPDVQYADGRLEVGGVLLVRAFDGDLTVRNLHLDRPFGLVPRLEADLVLSNLDLEAVTNTFSFGKIEGRLSGRVDGLRMEDWQPTAFEARFATPADDRSRHRISQRAVDNLSSIGGGVGGLLSRSFLGMFEEFPYDRLGLSCHLHNGVCEMGGVAPADNGYYIVKGRFLPPRIDVIGYADRVDWHTLIERLKSVTLEQAPEVR
ncbi:MAG: hypothetical protein K8I04_00575 [Gammaproteobacteria bacterium]|nr:hypothetical protein [Gammaproteobacteria bacterium]